MLAATLEYRAVIAGELAFGARLLKRRLTDCAHGLVLDVPEPAGDGDPLINLHFHFIVE